MATVFLNGAFTTQDDARISVFDAGLQHGVGLFETMLGGIRDDDDAWVLRLDEHLGRLIASARELGLTDQLRPAPLAEAVRSTVARSGLARARIRLTITGGDLNLLVKGKTPASPIQPTILIVAQPATEYPDQMFDQGVTAVIADMKANPLDPLAGHKTLNYWGRLRELQTAAARGAGEALVFQVTNHLAGGCVSNCFVVSDGVLLTPIARGEEGGTGDAATSAPSGPAIPSPVLPGITRGFILDWATRRGIRLQRRMITISDVLGADEVFLTNSSWGVLPVVRLEKEAIGTGAVGEISALARDAWLAAAPE